MQVRDSDGKVAVVQGGKDIRVQELQLVVLDGIRLFVARIQGFHPGKILRIHSVPVQPGLLLVIPDAVVAVERRPQCLELPAEGIFRSLEGKGVILAIRIDKVALLAAGQCQKSTKHENPELPHG